MVYRFIDDNKDEYGLRWLCRKFNLSTNAYYNYLESRKGDYRKRKIILLNIIKNIYYDNNRIIGHRGMVIFLKRKGISLSKTTVHKYMNRELNLHSVSMRKRVRYVRGERNKVFPNLLNQNFNTEEKNQIWCTDFTYIRLENGIIQSMSRSGCPYDNTPMERFYNTFKNELIYQNIYYSAATLDEAVSHYIFLWYNHVRPHSYNGGLTPFEARHKQK